MSALAIEYRPTAMLKPWKNNPRTHSKKQIRQIAESIKEFGFVNPVLIDGENRIIAGHGRVEAAKLLGMSEVPAVRIDHLSETQIRAYVNFASIMRMGIAGSALQLRRSFQPPRMLPDQSFTEIRMGTRWICCSTFVRLSVDSSRSNSKLTKGINLLLASG